MCWSLDTLLLHAFRSYLSIVIESSDEELDMQAAIAASVESNLGVTPLTTYVLACVYTCTS